MNFIKNSIILSFLNDIYTFCYDKFIDSKLYNLILYLGSKVMDSLIFNYLFSEHGFVDKWRDSKFVSGILWCLNLTPNILCKLNDRYPNIFKNSLFIKYADNLSFMVICILVLIMFMMPQENWSNMYSLIGVILALGLYFVSCINDYKKRITFDGIGTYLIIFSIICICSAFWGSNLLISIRFLLFLVTSIVLLLLVVNIIKDKKRLFTLISCIAIGILVSSIYAVCQHFDGVKPDMALTDLTVNSNMPGRVYSFFENPNSFAALLVFFLPLILSMIFCTEKWYNKVVFIVIFILGCIALILTFSRGAWLAFAFSLFVIVLIRYPKYSFLLILFGVVVLPFLPSSILDRILTIFSGDSSISLRGIIYSKTLSYIYTNPLFGSGLGMHSLQMMQYVLGIYPASIPLFVHAHNIYLEIWGESGLLALISFVLSMLILLVRSYKIVKNSNTNLWCSWINTGCVSCISGMLVFSFFEYAWSYPRIMVINWLLIAILCVVINLCKNINMKEL